MISPKEAAGIKRGDNAHRARLPAWLSGATAKLTDNLARGVPIFAALGCEATERGGQRFWHRVQTEKTMADTIADIAQRHGFSPDAARAVAEALRRSNGSMAQFNHPELGGMGQWVAGGMLMIGDMFNNDLKARVDALCRDLAGAPGPVPAAAEQPAGRSGNWWPDDLGSASAAGAQNDMRYACFPDRRRLAVRQDGRVRVFDTGEHRIGGFSQQQSSTQHLTFSSQLGTVRLEDLREIV
jgi:hypothetical protein